MAEITTSDGRNYSTTNELQRSQVVTLWMHGETPPDIARKTGFPVSACRETIKKAEAELKGLDAGMFKALCVTELQKLLKGHKDTSAELNRQFTMMQIGRDNTQADIDKGKLNKGDLFTASSAVGADNSALQDLAKQISQNEKTFIDSLTRMGVPQVAQERDEKGPPDSPLLSEYTDSAKVMDGKTEAILVRQLEYVRSQR